MDAPTLSFVAGKSPQAILHHPSFIDARRAYVRSVLALYEKDAFLCRLLMETARSMVFFSAVGLYFAQEADTRSTWPTMGLLQRTLASYGLSSPRRVDDLMARFIQAGYFRSEVVPADRRLRVLIATEKALAHDRAWLAAHFVPLEIMFPDTGYAVPCTGDLRFQAAQRRIGVQMVDYTTDVLTRNPVVTQFMMRDCGTMVLMSLVELAEAQGERSACRFAFADLAKPFGVSRTHVRDILRDAEAQALVAVHNGNITLTPALLAAFDRFVAAVMANHAVAFERTLRELDGV